MPAAGALAAALIGAGLALLLALAPLAALAGALALAWYNGAYTWLKGHSAFAAVPGALVGSLGPAIGWIAAGGELGSPALLLVMVIFFLWQVPHFWLLALRYADDYRRAGLPSPVESLGERPLRRVTLNWILSAALATLLLPLFGLLEHPGLVGLLAACALLVGAVSWRLLRRPRPAEEWLRLAFARLNLFVLATMVLLLVDQGLRR
jgi:protoheme IX farnesyltransferase